MPYKIRLECGNCYGRNNYQVDRGVSHNEAILVCPDCGCAPNNENYKVIVYNELRNHTKEEVGVDKS